MSGIGSYRFIGATIRRQSDPQHLHMLKMHRPHGVARSGSATAKLFEKGVEPVNLALGHELARQTAPQSAKRPEQGIVDPKPRSVARRRDEHHVIADEIKRAFALSGEPVATNDREGCS